MDDLLTIIRQLIPLDRVEEATVTVLFKAHHLDTGDHFLQAGEVCGYVGFVVQGLLRYYILDDGTEHTYDFSAERSFVCNYESFLPQLPSTRFIQALEPTQLWRISYHDLQQLYAQLEHGQQFGRLIAEQLFVDTLQKLTSFYRETAEQRYEQFLHLFPGLTERIPQYVVASYVGIKPQSLSRIRAQRAGKRY
jgi:CRP-like cAMP-binding protein